MLFYFSTLSLFCFRDYSQVYRHFHRKLFFQRKVMTNSPKVFAFIFARGGSKGVPKKNIKLLGGKPLIAHSIELARKCPSIAKVIVSTDCSEIANIAKSFGAEVPFLRPKNLAEDNSSEWLAWQHAVVEIQKNENFDFFISLPTTSPFRSVEDVECALKLLREDGVDFVISACPSERNPWFNMIKKNSKGLAELVNISSPPVIRRQDAPEVWDVTTVVYATTPKYILEHTKIFDGNVKFIEIPKARALDIDTEYDFQLAEFIYSQKKI
jgi:N-acylneuraminate cytidylyltransferase